MNDQTLSFFAEDATCRKTEGMKISLQSPEKINQKPWPPAGVDWYYSDEYSAIAHGDCRNVLPELEPVDLVLTSPPYNMAGNSLGYQPRSTVGQKLYGEYDDKVNEDDYSKWIISTIQRCLSISRYVFWNMQYLVSTKQTIHKIFAELDGNIKDIFIWKKQAVAQICVQHSPILANGFEFVFLLGEDNTKIFKYSNFPKNGYVPNIQDWYKKESFKEHHATFTQEMCKYFIEYFTKPSDIILDPFMGTATTILSAKTLNRKAIGIEIEEKYCEIAVKRLQQSVLEF